MADIKNNHFKGSIRDNGLDADIKDISVGNQDVFNNLSFTGYSLTQEKPIAGKILRSDGSDVIKWDDDIRVVNTTYLDLTNLITNSGLYPGSIYRFRYYIAGNTFHPSSYFDIYLKALTPNTISEDGIRVMRVPRRSYCYKSFVSRGFWDPSETYAINDLVVFAGRIYRNKTGSVGSVAYDIMLDRTNWEEKENTNPGDFSFITASKVYYQEKVFKIRYDFSKKLVVEQKDELGNTVTGIKDPQRRLDTFQNTIELNDWNYPRIFNNTTQGIWGNQTQIIANSKFADFDYAVIKYSWTSGNGTDLDTRTATVDLPDPLYNQVDLGWSRYGSGSMPTGGSYVGPSSSNYYLWWSGDFTGSSGNEACLVNFLNLESSYPTLQELTIRMRAFWYGNRLNGNMQLNITTYKGGTMSISGYNFINTGGTLVSNVTETYNMGLAASLDIDGEDIGTLTFDFATNTGFSLINNISEAYIKENNIPGTIHLNDNFRRDEVVPASYKSIKYNTNKGSIYSNTNKGNIEYNDSLGNINSNTGSYRYILGIDDNPVIFEINGITEIEYNSNHGNISSNQLSGLGKISYNSNHGNISSNNIGIETLYSSPSLFIDYNSNDGDISSNTYSYAGITLFSSSLGIRLNSNKGSITSNTVNYIGYNSNRGNISSNNSKNIGGAFDAETYGLISSNSNNGNITGNTVYAIEANSNDGYITNNIDSNTSTQWRINEITEGDHITGLSLTTNYTGYNFPQLIGTIDYILKSDGTNAVWAAAPGGGTVSGTGASPQVTLWSATSTVTGSPRITYVDNVGTEVGFRFDDGSNNLTQVGVSYLNVETEGTAQNSVSRLANWANNTNKGILSFRKSRGTKASPTQVLNGDSLGDIIYAGQTNFGTGSTTGIIRLEAKENYALSFDGTDYTRNALTELGVYLAPSVTVHSSSSGIPNNLVFRVDGNGSVSFKNYTFPTPDGTNGQALVTDGDGTVSWSTIAGGGIIYDTYSNIQSLVDVSGLQVGSWYSFNYIINSSFTAYFEIYLFAIENNKFALEGFRKMRVPQDSYYEGYYFDTRSNYGTNAKVVLGNVVFNALQFVGASGSGAYVHPYPGIPGGIGTDWEEVLYTDDNYYTSVIYSITYDFEQKKVKTQSDEKGNFIINSQQIYEGTIELHEWNNNRITNNRGWAVHHNLAYSPAGHACIVRNNNIKNKSVDSLSLPENFATGMIYSNVVSLSGGINNNNIDTAIVGNYVSSGKIESNISKLIYLNSVESSISFNEVDEIYDNEGGYIEYNTGKYSSIGENNSYVISHNNMRYSDPSGILRNWTGGSGTETIKGNDCGGIIDNTNTGDIEYNLGNFKIEYNSNSGDIVGNSSLSGSISNNSNGGFIRYNRTVTGISGNSNAAGNIEANDVYSINNA